MKMNLIILSFLSMALLVSCASHKTAFDEGSSAKNFVEREKLKNDIEVALSDWSQRHKSEKLNKAIQNLEKIAAKTDDNKDLLTTLARAYYFKAEYFAKEKNEKMSYWEKGAYYGEKAIISGNKELASFLIEGEKLENHLDKLKKEDTPALYWVASNLGKWGKSKGITTILKYKGTIKKYISKVEQSDNKFFHGAAYRYWGAYYAVAPAFAGGSLEKSEVYFGKSMDVSTQYLGTYILKAQFLATKKRDKALFSKLLNKVIQTKLDPKFEDYPDNLKAKEMAKKLLSEKDDLF
ncbi:TRAP transporter TatT component family protein [Bacteriovoracaceae bacterium]|nr:TRAP transporter TatT component family protein [Bacteriovoracaceae bacterium]